MRITGWIFTVLGILSLLGSLFKGNNPTGPTFWLGLGIFLIYRASQKEQEKKDKDKWNNDGKPL